MDDAQTAGGPVVKDTLAASIAGDMPDVLLARVGGSDKKWTVNFLSSYCSSAYDFNDSRFRRDAPTLAARAGVAALVSGVKVQAKRRHLGIISGLARATQKPRD